MFVNRFVQSTKTGRKSSAVSLCRVSNCRVLSFNKCGMHLFHLFCRFHCQSDSQSEKHRQEQAAVRLTLRRFWCGAVTNGREISKRTESKASHKKYLLLWLFSAVAGNFIQVECSQGSTIPPEDSDKKQLQLQLQATKLQLLSKSKKKQTQTIITYTRIRKGQQQTQNLIRKKHPKNWNLLTICKTNALQ